MKKNYDRPGTYEACCYTVGYLVPSTWYEYTVLVSPRPKYGSDVGAVPT